MKRPPSGPDSMGPRKRRKPRSGNVVPIFRNTKNKAPIEVPKFDRLEVKRLAIHQKNLRASVTKLRPRTSFGRRVWLGILASLASLLLLVAAAVFSSWLAVDKIDIVGADLVSESAIRKDLKGLLGKPLPQVSSEEVAIKLGKYELIESVSVISVPPNTLQIRITERSALCLVKINGISYRYDPAGVQLGRATTKDRLPAIIDAGNPESSKSFGRSVEVILALPLDLLKSVESVKASSKDNVLLSLRVNRQRILWGDNTQSALKSRVLQALMKHYKKSVGITFDVSSPNQPSVY